MNFRLVLLFFFFILSDLAFGQIKYSEYIEGLGCSKMKSSYICKDFNLTAEIPDSQTVIFKQLTKTKNSRTDIFSSLISAKFFERLEKRIGADAQYKITSALSETDKKKDHRKIVLCFKSTPGISCRENLEISSVKDTASYLFTSNIAVY